MDGDDCERTSGSSYDRIADRPLNRLVSLLIGRGPGAERRIRILGARRLVASGLFDPRWIRLNGGEIGPSEGFDAPRYRTLHPDSGSSPDAIAAHFLARAEAADAAIGPEIRAAVDPLPSALRTGLGTALYVKGWCYPTRGRIRFLDLLLGDRRIAITDHSQPRPDVQEIEAARDPDVRSFYSGFEICLDIPPVAARTTHDLRLRLVTDRGDVSEQTLGTLTLDPGTGAMPLAVAWPGDGPRVAIAMATHNPPIDLFAEQIASITAQTHRNWICVVSDDGSSEAVLARMAPILAADPRFVLARSPHRLGFYRNFERALQLVPADATHVALSDQDDRWHSDKLATLLGALGQRDLVAGDVRIVTRDGAVLSETFWVTRRNNVTSLPSLLSANTIMGAASLFRAPLLARILPFPERLGAAYHDHWIGLSALAAGGIASVDRPLHDYVQHGGNVIGHKHDADAPGLKAAARDLVGTLRARGPLGHVVRSMLVRATEDRQSLVAQKILLSRILLLRHPGARAEVRKVLARYGGLSRVGPAFRERIRAALQGRPTLNHEGHFLRAVLISRTREALYRGLAPRLTRRLRRERYRAAMRNHLAVGDAAAPIDFGSAGRGRDIPAMAFGHVGWIFHNIAPLTLRPSPGEPKRVNLLLATIDFKVLFGGYIGMFNFALRLSRAGHAVRIILLDETEVRLDDWRARIARYPGIERLFDEVEVSYRYDRSLPLDVSPEDGFVATSGWSAHVAHRAVRELGRKRFLFLIQEYEPFFGPMNTNTALLRQAYDLPQFGLFSTEILRDYFRRERIGLFETPEGDEQSAVFSNAIQRFLPTRSDLERRSRRILFYARPEDHAARNLFEMGIAALCRLFADPEIVRAGWTAHGIGTIGSADRLELAPGIFLGMTPKTSLAGYTAMLPGFDVGLSLMLTPHPSLVPLEMAAAGLVTVTNSFANKTAEILRDISPNLIGAPPTLEGIVDGLREAIARTDDIEGRLAGARAMTWPTDWDAAFPVETMTKVEAFLAEG